MALYALLRRWRPGRRVAHISLDDARGSAKAGHLEELVGDDNSGLVIAEWDDERRLAGYDRREVVGLIGSSRGPILLYPRHLRALLRNPWAGLSVVAAFISGMALAVVSALGNWSVEQIIAVGAAMILLALAGLLVAESVCLLRERRQKSST